MKSGDLQQPLLNTINKIKNQVSLSDLEDDDDDDDSDKKTESSYTEGVLNGVRILKAKNAMKRVEKSKQKLLDEIRALKAKRDKLKIDADNTAHNMMGGIKARNLEMKVNHVNNQIKKKLMEYNKLKAQTTSIDDEITSSEE
jgi:predicted RNase H-like nuclease (RuvC/YqgF family)